MAWAVIWFIYSVCAFGYDDDVILLYPYLKYICEMLKICKDYKKFHNILFNVMKGNTKAMLSIVWILCDC